MISFLAIIGAYEAIEALDKGMRCQSKFCLDFSKSSKNEKNGNVVSFLWNFTAFMKQTVCNGNSVQLTKENILIRTN